jgi:glycosyltransferase involved in cell wall biosynthesis/LmbE family N-acetylglucosaminyl deacetylase
MQILIAGSTYPPQINGQSVFTGNLAAGMTGRGHDVLVMTPSCSSRPYRTIENGVLRWSVRSLDLNFFHHDLYIAFDYEGMVNEALDTFQPDIIHLQDSAPLNRCLLRHARRRGIPVIITHHIGPAVGAPYFTWFTDLFGGRMEGFVWNWITSFLNQADLLTAPSRAAANMLRRHRVIPPVWPVSCGVHIEDFQPKQEIAQVNLRGVENCPIFLYVGRLDWEKRPDVILRALALLPPGSAQLILAGTGAAEKDLKALAQKLQIEAHVRFLGDVQHDNVPALYASCDIFVMPGDAESLSIATLEAMAAGKPVLAANSMALPELVETGVNGLLFQPRNHQHAAEQMQWFIDHKRDWKRMGRASIQTAAAHSIPAVMTQFEMLYRDTAAHSQSRKPSRPTQPAFNAISWMSQRLLPHLKVIFLLVFLFLASGSIYSETIAAPIVRLENVQTLTFEDTRRILILSAHPDDAVLAVGGLIQNAIEHDIFIQTVVVTNGDEFEALPSLLEPGMPPKPIGGFSVKRYHAETLSAMAVLGVPEDRVIFLGYDPGFWKIDQYKMGLDETPHGKTQRAALLEDLHQLFAAYPPDILIIPHPGDGHPDRKAVSQAARTAAALQFTNQADTPVILGYLIDYENYPGPNDLIDISPLLPPSGLTNPDPAWVNMHLDQNQVQIKRSAIQRFSFEANHLGWVLSSFAHSNEVFTPLTIRHMPTGMPLNAGNPASILLEQLQPFTSGLLGKEP